eukprot:g32400.t1
MQGWVMQGCFSEDRPAEATSATSLKNSASVTEKEPTRDHSDVQGWRKRPKVGIPGTASTSNSTSELRRAPGVLCTSPLRDAAQLFLRLGRGKRGRRQQHTCCHRCEREPNQRRGRESGVRAVSLLRLAGGETEVATGWLTATRLANREPNQLVINPAFRKLQLVASYRAWGGLPIERSE